MSYNVIGKDVERWDAVAKVKGKADFTADIPMKNMLHGKICRATIAHGVVKAIDFTEALRVPGVIKVLTPDDLPDVKFTTAGHPYALNPKQRDVYDRNILTKKVRLYGDEIAAVIAETELAAEIAVEKIKVTYEEYPFYLKPEQSLADDAIEIHEGTKNIIASTVVDIGEIEDGFNKAELILEDEFSTQIVQHCHMESQIAYAYEDADKRWVCVSSTQIPHICRRILGEALDMPWGRFRVIKPFIGGGFGNKQDVTIEPLVVAMSMACGGRPVMIKLTREESMAYTRVRHAISYKAKIGVTKDGLITALNMECVSNNGAYASHGHAIAGKGAGFLVALYKIPNLKYSAKTVYTNTASAGAMRGYGIPQVMFAMESLMEKVAKKLNMNPIELRVKNLIPEGTLNPINKIYQYTNKLDLCLNDGKKLFDWDVKKESSSNYKSGDFRCGVGVAAFAYGSGVYPKGHEIAGCRLILNQDGSIKLMLGATEIGQGADTVFKQMVAETVGVDVDTIYVDSVTDTDTSPFDTGSYASRQTYVSGMAVKAAALDLKEKILNSVNKFNETDCEMDIVNGVIINKQSQEKIELLSDLAIKTYYHLEKGSCLVGESSTICRDNSYSMGASFAEVEVDIKTGKINILSMLNVHDSGQIINPKLASGQVEGGMSMGIGFGLSEELRYDEKTGKPLNNNLLDYKLPTTMDITDLQCSFIDDTDPVGPYGNKALGEPPTCSPAPAIRNAVLDAIGVELNHLPMSPQKVFQSIKNRGLGGCL